MDYVQLFWDIYWAVVKVHERQKIECHKQAVWLLLNDQHGPVNKPDRWWWNELTDTYDDPHPAVLLMLERGYRARDMHLLVLQWPHVSTTDDKRLAYTQNEAKGRRNIQTITSIGKYLHAHFDAPDHVIRDVAALSLVDCTFHITQEMSEMLDIITNDDVHSCMVNFSRDEHPYRVYKPGYGWGMAYRNDMNGELIGRALVYEKNGHKCFVRTYHKDEDSDTVLASWLEDQGYVHLGAWPAGAKLAKIELYDDRFIAPYLDGVNDDVNEHDSYFVITSGRGEHCFSDSDGFIEIPQYRCEKCGDRTGEDQLTSVGADEDTRVCDDCLSRHFSFVRGASSFSRYREYYVPDEDAKEDVDYSTLYDMDNLPEGVICLDNGRHEGEPCREEHAVYDSDGNSWHEDDVTEDPDEDGLIKLTAGRYEGDYVNTHEAFKCDHDGEIYHWNADNPIKEGDVYVAKDNHEDWLEAREEAEDEAAAES